MAASSSIDEMMAELEKLSELERLVATLPSSPPPSPSRKPQGLSFSVAGVGLGSTSSGNLAASSSVESWERFPRMPSELLDSTLSLDFGILGSSGISLPVSANSSQNAESGEGRGRLLVHYVGGSVTFLLKIAVVAWSVRFLRRVWARHRESSQINASVVSLPLFSTLSPKALRKLMELDSVDFCIIDVRHPDAASNPFALKNVVNIPESELKTCLQLTESLWSSRFRDRKQPTKEDLLVFVSTRGQRAERAAIATAELGFKRCCVLSGGIQSFDSDTEDSPCSINFLGRDAVAFLLQEKTVKFCLLDVRRLEERLRYGYISVSLHIPAEDWPKALAMDDTNWERKYHLPKIGLNDVVVLYSRDCKRAVWIAQLCLDAGFARCYVCESGTYGWRLDPNVLPYDAFKQGDLPPEPMEFQVETMDSEAAEAELRTKGLLPYDCLNQGEPATLDQTTLDSAPVEAEAEDTQKASTPTSIQEEA